MTARRPRTRRRPPVALALLATLSLLAGCSGGSSEDATGPTDPVAATAPEDPWAGRPSIDAGAPTTPASFEVRGGVEQVTVTRAAPGTPLTLVDGRGRKIVTLLADDRGQAVFAYVPLEYRTMGSGADAPSMADGRALVPGDGFHVRDERAEPDAVSAPFRVLRRDDHPAPAHYEGQRLDGVPWAIIGGKPVEGRTAGEGFGYITTRDGVRLSAMVRLPDPSVYGPGPYPTVVEYSGYGPSNPAKPEPGSMIATSMGFATVGVNMRGSGCSGGTFDVFNPAQQADGYDVIEAVARQPWVKHGKVGMIGLSYSGITQLYVASTRPPSLAGITPLSVIEDPWQMSWPGGIYNAGFTKQWLTERDNQAKAGGQEWVQQRIDGGDTTCADNQQLRSQNIDFERFARSLEFRPRDADARDLSKLVRDIEVPVYLTGAWQDEQTGPRFATMLENFTGTNRKHFVLFNGHHPDGYTPINLSRWLEFLQLYVDRSVPKVPALVRVGGPALFEDSFGVPGLNLEPDRFGDARDLADALRRFEADPMVTVRLEMGAGREDVPGAPLPRDEVTFSAWPPPQAEARTWYLGAEGALGGDRPTGAGAGADSFRFDPTIGFVGYAPGKSGDFIKPTVPLDWRPTAPGTGLSYVTEPLREDTTIAGAGHVQLWLRSDAPDAGIEVVLSEITAEGTEFRVQNGLLRAGHRTVDERRSSGTAVAHSFTRDAYRPLPAGEVTEVKVPIYPVAAVLRAGSRLRLQINTPGGDLPLWFFENPDFGRPDARHVIARDAAHPSALVLPLLPAGMVRAQGTHPPCPSLRGQACRPYVPLVNEPG